ncbi:glycosyltransferase [Lachnospiraceae bacterium]|nr:glycosyltransferase [Lachnospiraceae bacterium]
MKVKEKNFVSAVVYVYNAQDRVKDFLELVLEVLEENFEHSEIICVNDCSGDDSVEMIKQASKKAGKTNVSILNMSYFHGLELSMNAGLDLAIGDFVFEFDTTEIDFDKQEIMKIYRRSLEGYDIVSAIPDRKEKFTSRCFYNVFERFSNLPYKMNTESFRILSRRVINRINSMNKTVPYRKAIYANCGLKTDMMKYTCREGGGGAKHDRKEKKYRMRLAVDSMLLFTEAGYHFSIAMTILMMIMSIFMVAYSVITYLTAHPVAGWTTTILFLSVVFLGLFGVLTVIIKYLQLLVELIFKRKRYSFESIEKITK